MLQVGCQFTDELGQLQRVGFTTFLQIICDNSSAKILEEEEKEGEKGGPSCHSLTCHQLGKMRTNLNN